MAQTQRLPSERYTFTTPALLAFPNLFEARAYEGAGGGDGTLRYDTKVLMRPDHPDVAGINAVLVRLKEKHFSHLQVSQMHFCLQSGDKMANDGQQQVPPQNLEIYRGWIVLTARTKFLDKQALGVILNGKITDVPPAPESAAFERYFYGGAGAMLEIELVPYPGNRLIPSGISCWPKSVLALNNPEKYPPMPEFAAGGRTRASSTWGDKIAQHVGHVSQVDPTAGMAGGIL